MTSIDSPECVHGWAVFNPAPCPQCTERQVGKSPAFAAPYGRDYVASGPGLVEITGSVGMRGLLNDVANFHRACDVPVLDKPALPSPARMQLRADLLDEEMTELTDAMAAGVLVEIADALADIVYVAVGAALEFGIPLDRVWAEVQRSNMAKVDPATGKAARREDGKILKPAGWVPPDVAGAIT